uniref:Uncharacterized protein n=1 Tax=Roseihalotalea indica TaxID=2867963 RepID=A0AA49JAY0_9BACT|nr:hypothetical protein K4G66_16580 [Tunicatimonas sp. TK19036]
MKNAFKIIFFGLISCTDPTSNRKIENLLAGQWQYEPVAWNGDTISYEISDDFDSTVSTTEKITLQTDSGNYQHIYQNDSLISIKPYKDRWIAEYVFDDESSGTLYHYIIDAPIDREHPRLFGQKSRFRINIEDSISEIEVIYEADSAFVSEERIIKITFDTLILEHDTIQTIYKRINEP